MISKTRSLWISFTLLVIVVVYFGIEMKQVQFYLYYSSSVGVTYAGASSSFPRNSASIWSKRFGYGETPENILNTTLCRSLGDDRLSILVVVSSTKARHEARSAVRASWATYFKENSWMNAAVIFVIGTMNTTTAEKSLLQAEQYQFNDLLLIDILDTYHNLSLKTALTFRWISSNCPGAKFVLKTDDDTIVFGQNLVRYLFQYYHFNQADLLNGPVNPAPIRPTADSLAPEIHCYVFKYSKVMRDLERWKDFVPFEVYPARYYPPFCSGHAYLLTETALRRVWRYAETLSFYYHLEDVLLTGIVAKMASIRLISRQEFHGEHYDSVHPFSPDDPRWKPAFKNYFTIHYVKNATLMMNIWRNYIRVTG